jgi:transposase
MICAGKPYPSDVSDEEWVLVAPYLTLLPKEAGQRERSLWEGFNGLPYLIKTGAPGRWMNAGCFKELAHHLRAVLRLAAGRN